MKAVQLIGEELLLNVPPREQVRDFFDVAEGCRMVEFTPCALQ
jgi:hypothetical protein